MEYFSAPGSIVRKIWGTPDVTLFIFAGASAEFALNKTVDWLYFTGKLPADPIGRLFSTVAYAKAIVFAENAKALSAIDKITQIHKAVESARGSEIPQWAYRDVLFMLIHYSIASYELLERALTLDEKQQVYHVFHKVGVRMGITSLPADYLNWIPVHEAHLKEHLVKSHFTKDLYQQYRKHLGPFRYRILLHCQAETVPIQVRKMLAFKKDVSLLLLLQCYKAIRGSYTMWLIKYLLPKKYWSNYKHLQA